jgi:Na+-translocating ferredoxin:NAD+ oxidoreductase subunit G
MKNIVGATVLLALFAVVGTGLVAFTQDRTAQRIADNEREALLHSLNEVIPKASYDNDIFHDTTEVTAPKLLGVKDAVTVYRARKDGKPVAAALTVVAPDGYNGDIKLLVGIRYDGALSGVRAIAESETPGLGDNIETDRSDWILNFTGKSLSNPDAKGWAVKKDGGTFDQFTGATITPRAVVKAVHRALLYFKDHRDALFAVKGAEPKSMPPAESPTPPTTDGAQQTQSGS